MGLHKVSTLVSAWTTYEVGMGIPEAATENLYALTYHYWNVEDFSKDLAAKCKPLVDGHTKKFGLPPDAYAVLIYDACDILFQAIQKAGSVDSKKIGEVLGKETFSTAKGPGKFRRITN